MSTREKTSDALHRLGISLAIVGAFLCMLTLLFGIVSAARAADMRPYLGGFFGVSAVGLGCLVTEMLINIWASKQK